MGRDTQGEHHVTTEAGPEVMEPRVICHHQKLEEAREESPLQPARVEGHNRERKKIVLFVVLCYRSSKKRMRTLSYSISSAATCQEVSTHESINPVLPAAIPLGNT